MRIYVKVKPNAVSNEVKKISEGEYAVQLTAVPERGKANKLLIKLLAKYFGVSQSEVVIVGGKTARVKIVDIGWDL
jgi:uncharacterized protein